MALSDCDPYSEPIHACRYSMPSPLIQLHAVTRSFRQGGNHLDVLSDINLNIDSGEFVTVTGPSGSGKSTLLNILGLLDEPTQGSYYLDGISIESLTERERTKMHRERIGFVFQAYHLLDDLTVYENLEAPLLYQKLPGAERKAQVAEMLDRFAMVAKKDLFPSQLSGGQQQLVGVARALIIQPSLILADEPTGNLHSSQAEPVMEAFRELNERDGVTIIQVSHSDRAAAYGRRVIELFDGRIVQDGPVLSNLAPTSLSQ